MAGVSFVALSGCGGPALKDTVPVTGKVTHNGEPIEGAMVTFLPQGDHRAASGRTNASGIYKLTTLEPEDGAMPGPYRVSISKTEVSASRGSDDEPPPSINPEWPPLTATELVPVKYKHADSSGLTAEVSQGKNEINFELED